MDLKRAMRAGFAVIFVACGAPARSGAAQEIAAPRETVHVVNWSDYIDPRVLDDFTAETGIRVVYDSYNSSDALEQRLMAGKTGYDVVVSSAGLLQKEIRSGVLQKLDRTKLSNLGNLAPEVTGRLAGVDPGNLYAVSYMWYAFGIVYDVAKARARLGATDPAVMFSSWDAVFRPDLAKQFADCGIALLDSPRDLFAIALASQKMNPEPRGEADVARAADALTRGKSFVKRARSPELINGFAKGEVCLAVATSGDGVQARNRARDSGKNVEIGFTVPREGAPAAVDVLTILKDAPHLAAAYKFIDYLLRPEVAARNVEATGAASGVAGAQALVGPKLAGDPLVYPGPDVAKRVFAVPAVDLRLEAAEGRAWAKVTPAHEAVAQTPEPRLCQARNRSRTGLLAMRCRAAAKAAKAAEALKTASAKAAAPAKPGASAKSGAPAKPGALAKRGKAGKLPSRRH
jgi:putrescine transport system substrate-binding protein